MFFNDPPESFDPNADDLDAQLDEEFPLGDGTAETEAVVLCPYCAAAVTMTLDPGSGPVQEYVEDCEVCCQPWSVCVTYDDGRAHVSVSPLDT
jgi:hypothetical protein